MRRSPTPPPAGQQVSKKFHLWLDEPLDWNLKVRRLRLSGWCVAKDGAPRTRVRGQIGAATFYGQFDRDRPGVVQFLNVPEALRWCGFAVDVVVPFGRKRLELEVATADGEWQKAYARTVVGPLRIGPAERELWQKIDEADAQRRYAFFFSRPDDWNKPARLLRVIGWCVDRSGDWIRAVRAVVGGLTFQGGYGIERPDVAALFPHLPAARHSGFVLMVELQPGKQTIRLEVKGGDGSWRLFFVSEVIGGDSADDELTPDEIAHFAAFERPPRFQFWFDRPADWAKPVRHLRISGWCIAAWGEQIDELRARVRGKTYNASYGIVRPDVAATLDSGAAALRSGFAMDVVVPWGPSTPVLEARGAGEAWEQFFWTRRPRSRS